MIDLHNIDCMEYMAGLEDNAFELAIVDPPYGLGSKLTSGGVGPTGPLQIGRGFGNQIESKSDEWDKPPPQEYFDTLFRVSRNQIIWGGNYFNLPATRGIICWDKLKGANKNLSHWEFAWTSFDKRALMFKKTNNGGFILKEKKIHPTQKPVELYQWLLQNYAKPGDRILDTHLGSGSSAIAAHYGGFDFVGCELDEDYYNAACKRFDAETAQAALF